MSKKIVMEFDRKDIPRIVRLLSPFSEERVKEIITAVLDDMEEEAPVMACPDCGVWVYVVSVAGDVTRTLIVGVDDEDDERVILSFVDHSDKERVFELFVTRKCPVCRSEKNNLLFTNELLI